ncbi:hypothetical protein TEA_028328 [Camellia sinensis var. sinensis]|uniref:Uncharacterized protein n=1 Tax=Camellia sinensis var. sinensis TaxID=542762 RepID=A0A4S4EQV2_CAMSN|nr:hypothetical protein TEA_028328 [Camellia sinensis var. sinensis]
MKAKAPLEIERVVVRDLEHLLFVYKIGVLMLKEAMDMWRALVDSTNSDISPIAMFYDSSLWASSIIGAPEGGFELPTRLSVAAADCILALTEALTKKDLVSDGSDDRLKPSNPNLSFLPITSAPAAFVEKKVKPTSRSPDVLNNMEMKLLLWDHLDELIILVQRLDAVRFEIESNYKEFFSSLLSFTVRFLHQLGSQMHKTGVLLLSSCWKHYGMLMHLEDYKFYWHYKELVDQYLSGIQLESSDAGFISYDMIQFSKVSIRTVADKPHMQFYADNYTEEHAENKESGVETIKFFLNCLSLLLGHLDGKQFENAMSEDGLRISRVLISQLHCADVDVIDGAVCILKAVIFRSNSSLAGSSLTNTREMDALLPLLLHLLDERDGTARAVVVLIAEYCSISTDNQCLKEVLQRLASGAVLQRRNAIDVISELFHISPDSVYCRQDIANHLLKLLGDEELVIRAQATKLIPMMDPSLLLPALVRLVCSSDEVVHSSARNAFVAVLKYHNKKFEVLCMLLDCLSNICQNPDLPQALGDRGKEGSKLDADRVLKLIPQWSESDVLDNDDRARKNLHAFIGHIYLPPFIQVMEAFAKYKPLDQPLDQDFAKMDLGNSSVAPKLSTWDEAVSSSSGNTG